MNLKRVSLVLAFCLSVVFACFASEANVGSWKLNESKSKIPAGVAKNTSVVYTEEGDQLKAVVDGVDGTGKPTHNEWTGKFDGKPYPTTGDPTVDTRTITKVDDHHIKIVNKKGDKEVSTGTVEISKDGKTRTLVVTSTDAKGKKAKATYVYDRQ